MGGAPLLMSRPELPPNESQRLALTRYRLLDGADQPELDTLVRLAGRICDAPLALISLVERDRQFFSGRLGLELTETFREVSFGADTSQDWSLLELTDMHLDDRFAALNHAVRSSPLCRLSSGAERSRSC